MDHVHTHPQAQAPALTTKHTNSNDLRKVPRIGSFFSLATERRANTTAAAPSVVWEELAAVVLPPEREGQRSGR